MKFLEPKNLEVTTTLVQPTPEPGGIITIPEHARLFHVPTNEGYEDYYQIVEVKTPVPNIILVSHRIFAHLRPGGLWWMKEFGYRPYKKDLTMLLEYYARPWPLWALLCGMQKMRRVWWYLLRVTYKRLWHIWGEGLEFRWRNIRLGPGKKN